MNKGISLNLHSDREKLINAIFVREYKKLDVKGLISCAANSRRAQRMRRERRACRKAIASGRRRTIDGRLKCKWRRSTLFRRVRAPASARLFQIRSRPFPLGAERHANKRRRHKNPARENPARPQPTPTSPSVSPSRADKP